MTEIVITRGLPGSGKTTWARQWVAEDEDRAALSRDDFRAMLFDGEGVLTHDQENVVTVAMKAAVKALVHEGTSVVLHDTNLRAYARDWADLAQSLGVDFSNVDFRADVELCKARNEARRDAGGRYVDPRAIDGMAQRFPASKWKPITPRHNLSAIEPYSYQLDLQDAYIFDIDGTLAHFRDRSPFDWDRVGEDEPDFDVIRVHNALKSFGRIIVMSGRDESCREQTARWLEDHGIQPRLLLMRAKGDNRRDSLVKLDLFNKHIRGQYNVLGVFDDRNQVVEMWRALGLKCFQVAEGNF
ncbi:AAA family ATPase [Nocardia sp. NPDC056611]|uniref:phosphatase domain-containing protein n=1 Tax=Nocardia sp. NPDC056611 TaxID=3345877 RepID=UPI00366DBE02